MFRSGETQTEREPHPSGQMALSEVQAFIAEMREMMDDHDSLRLPDTKAGVMSGVPDGVCAVEYVEDAECGWEVCSSGDNSGAAGEIYSRADFEQTQTY